MSQEFVMDIGRQALYVFLELSAPILIITLAVGLLVSIIQATTQIQEQTLTFIPKILAVILILILLGPWMLNVITSYTNNLLSNIIQYIR
ncbi:flagellar biosynthesis protein FliQ [Calorimonas adulescens]|jgi:flagellar biosynthetic protein FliQ|uniref:Flagellar biosynthetic protein FliQ n=1 Tax=Calorimonas adulescens TaxID=2606906 RepID=A0A5D8QF77_9THEO|nr:flagellar biosynthesis protein FliQ [Calorimonas adulescens]TZE83340.1 flagellar biosynthesis protein FliQ [Calorimonas adulescens]